MFELEERKGNLLDCPINECRTIAHCVSTDFALGMGIAKTIIDTYPEMRFKLNQVTQERKVKIGECIGYTDNQSRRNIINLVTKEKYFQKPTYNDIEVVLRNFKDILIKHKIHIFAIPRIGCGLDKLDWERVLYILKGVFYDFDGKCIVYFLESEPSPTCLTAEVGASGV